MGKRTDELEEKLRKRFFEKGKTGLAERAATKPERLKRIMEDFGDEHEDILKTGGVFSAPLFRFIDVEEATPKMLILANFDDGWPEWLEIAHLSALGLWGTAVIVASVEDRKLSKAIEEAATEYRITLDYVAAAVELMPDVSEPAQKSFEMLLQRARFDIITAVKNALPAWKKAKADKESNLPNHNALHNQAKNWTRHITDHPEWKDRNEKSNRWKVSNAKVVKKLTRIDPDLKPPSADTVNRYRNENFK